MPYRIGQGSSWVRHLTRLQLVPPGSQRSPGAPRGHPVATRLQFPAWSHWRPRRLSHPRERDILSPLCLVPLSLPSPATRVTGQLPPGQMTSLPARHFPLSRPGHRLSLSRTARRAAGFLSSSHPHLSDTGTAIIAPLHRSPLRISPAPFCIGAAPLSIGSAVIPGSPLARLPASPFLGIALHRQPCMDPMTSSPGRCPLRPGLSAW